MIVVVWSRSVSVDSPSVECCGGRVVLLACFVVLFACLAGLVFSLVDPIVEQGKSCRGEPPAEVFLFCRIKESLG